MKSSLNEMQKEIIMRILYDSINNYFERIINNKTDIGKGLTACYTALNQIYSSHGKESYELTKANILLAYPVLTKSHDDYVLLNGFETINNILHDYEAMLQLNLHKLGDNNNAGKTIILAKNFVSDLMFSFINDLYQLKENRNIKNSELKSVLFVLVDGLKYSQNPNYLENKSVLLIMGVKQDSKRIV